MKVKISFVILLTLFIGIKDFGHGLPASLKLMNLDEICPRIISRSEWNARNVTGHQPLWTVPVPYVMVHHGGILHYCYDQRGCSEIVRSYQDLHMDKNGWIDIGYHFVIGEDGNVYEGRGWDYIGAHSPGYNSQSIGVSIIGDFSHFLPNKGALRALDALIACGVSLGKVSKDYEILGHRQARDTVCPGEVFYSYVMKMPRWTANPVPVCMSNCAYKPNINNSSRGSVEKHDDVASGDQNIVTLVQ